MSEELKSEEKSFEIIETYLLMFQKDDKKSYFDYKNGKWQFWGDLEIDESAKLFFESIGESLTKYIQDNFVMVEGKLQKKS